ncbi:P-loop containing nucleoside triphosphate hydrolase [Forsythia ovata]|uniref:P-loop containing nucleoside triphosphate hydrolase n=1 Tax=Forsythia ovata TaxID=205694 RepID=A0ABD1X5T0_9LAMI
MKFNEYKSNSILNNDFYQGISIHERIASGCGPRLGQILIAKNSCNYALAEHPTLYVELYFECLANSVQEDVVRNPNDANVAKGIAKEVAKECGGIPLALVSVGKALKIRHPHKWRDVLQKLPTS